MTGTERTAARKACAAFVLTAIFVHAGVVGAEQDVPDAQAPSRDSVRKELDSVRKNLEAQTAREQQRSQRAAHLLDEIAALDQRLLASARKRDVLHAEERELQFEYEQQLEQLEASEQRYRRARAVLSRRLSSIYKRGRLGSSRVLAKAATASEPLRMARYLAAISKADGRALAEFETLRYRHEQALRGLADKRKAIAGKNAALQDEARRYEAARADKSELLESLETELRTQQQRVEELRSNEEELQTLLASIPPPPVIVDEENLPPAPPAPVGEEGPPGRLSRLFRAQRPGAPLADRKGDLEVPVRGAVVSRFGEQPEGAARLQGVLVRADRDHQVVAVAAGEVVFAGPFPGLGNTLIINHGGRYHTVYAGLASIFHEVGARTRENEVIGTLASGQPTLHFELRAEGKALDPVDWFRGGLAAFTP